MLNHTIMNTLRSSAFRMTTAADEASRKFTYQNVKMRRLKYKSTARDRRKAKQRALGTTGIITPRDTGEEQPPFFMPARYKLLVKCYQEARNSNRFSRKPIPDPVKLEFAKKSKEY
jgi:hypothetical protein